LAGGPHLVRTFFLKITKTIDKVNLTAIEGETDTFGEFFNFLLFYNPGCIALVWEIGKCNCDFIFRESLVGVIKVKS